jgi:hypothetical protein
MVLLFLLTLISSSYEPFFISMNYNKVYEVCNSMEEYSLIIKTDTSLHYFCEDGDIDIRFNFKKTKCKTFVYETIISTDHFLGKNLVDYYNTRKAWTYMGKDNYIYNVVHPINIQVIITDANYIFKCKYL